MALFGKSRDINLFHTINSELLKDIIQTEIAYYKFALEQTKINVYGEAPGKNYFEPLKIACLIDKQDQSWSSDNFGSDVNQTIGFKFLKNELKSINLIPEVGDLLLFKTDHGDSFSILVNTHISRVEKLNLIPLRGGKYPTTTKIDGGIANLRG